MRGSCSIRVNNQYRLIFKWNSERGEADGIYLDAHSYRR
ncbi:MAG: type II toxin-antitoxin system RelE/ParE family toxin [Deltaproteobacteria bacterium]|nr:type II toxin-antitoxin system RelE/ParE family toxin [Deltaproteobacteria bacterium]MBW1819473.1 type II toxin-antitoxin system RelE/ParE family toxin [Deltaproteobacteria bacterium]MBW2283609.1 type II toxin-antitoxin system RelE/ParE family toxin [Deltaproteobacteria bacterium]